LRKLPDERCWWCHTIRRIFCFADRIANMDDGRVISIETSPS
jgi:hypothetical protein